MNVKNSIKIDLRKKNIIIIILLPLIIGAIVYLVVIPSINDIKNIKNEIEAQRIDLEIKYEKGQSLKELTKNLELIEPQLSKLDQIFIKQDDLLNFITTLEDTASDNGIIQKINLATSNSIKEDNYQKTPLQIITKSNFKNQMNYLLDLEALSYYININTLDLNFNSPGLITGDGQVIGSTINMLIFADTFWKQQ